MKRLVIKKVVKNHIVSAAGCGKNWNNLCGTRD
jgi:hypothetical protein